MTEEQVIGVRKLHAAADRLRMACVEATGGKALLHIAFDREAEQTVPIREELLMVQLRAIP